MNSTPETFKPTLILHGGAGNIQRSTLPPDLYAKYHASLLSYLRSTKKLLDNGASALDAAVHAVSLMEDDELFNCGRGSVFTSTGKIEMEASVMVTTVQRDTDSFDGAIKRGVGVMGLRNVRHPIHLARESLLRSGYNANGEPNGDGGSMHSQLAGPYVEELARDWGLEFEPDEWFWTKRRWDEHCRGLKGEREPISMSQGTVGCVCLDRWGNLAVATSTGGLTNKLPGRIGDTPTLGAGFWAESWDVKATSSGLSSSSATALQRDPPFPSWHSGSIPGDGAFSGFWDKIRTIRSVLGDCLPSTLRGETPPPAYTPLPSSSSVSCTHSQTPYLPEKLLHNPTPTDTTTRRAIAISGTGNGDSFLRIDAARTAAAMLRFSPASFSSLAEAVTAVTGREGELQRSAGQRWGKTGEGEGGMIGIEAEGDADVNGDGGAVTWNEGRGKGLQRGKVVFDFNCGGMWRAWIQEDENGKEVERVMVFREEYQ